MIIYYAYTNYGNVENIQFDMFKGLPEDDILENIAVKELHEDFCINIDFWRIWKDLSVPECEDPHIKNIVIKVVTGTTHGSNEYQYIDASNHCVDKDANGVI